MDKFSLKKRKRAKKRSQSSSSSSQSSSSSSQDEKFKKRQHCLDGGQLGRSLKKRKRKESFSESSGSSSSESGRDKIRKKRRKLKKREKKERKDKRKKEKREKRKKSGKEKKDASELLGTAVTGEDFVTVSMPPENQVQTEPTKRRSMAPITKQEYEKQQSHVRRVFDPDTGRHRLVKGDGEIIEEVVSYQRHKEINKLATSGDGAAFQKSLGLQK